MALYAVACLAVPKTMCAVAQAGVRAVVDAVGRLVLRGVLPSLRRLSLGRGSLQPGEQAPPAVAAPHVETALLLGGRKPHGQHFWVTDDVLPDLHVALGMREGYDWESRRRY